MVLKVYQNRKSHKPGKRDDCQTPNYAILPLLPYLSKDLIIWEPAKGEGLLVKAFEFYGYTVISSGIEENFFEYKPPYYSVIITNPPFSLSRQFLQRCFELGKPFALLMKTDKIQDVGIQKLCAKYGNLEQIHPDCRIDYKMPSKGWATGSPFNTNWYTYGFCIGKSHTYLSPIKEAKKMFKINWCGTCGKKCDNEFCSVECSQYVDFDEMPEDWFK